MRFLKNALPFLFLLTLLPLTLFSQRGKWLKKQTIYGATTINYYPSLEPYAFSNTFTDEGDDLILTFLRENSGTFVIEEGEPLVVTRQRTHELPSNLLSIGASIQFISEKGTFHEVSLSKLAFSKSSYRDEYTFMDTLGDVRTFIRGYEHKTSAFAMRYEFGKYFGDRKSSNLRFGLAGSVEPSWYTYSWEPLSSGDFKYSANLFNIEIALIPMVSAKVSKKVTFDFKLIPNMLIADFGSVKQLNPLLTAEQQMGTRTYDLPEINLAFSMLMRYQIQEAKKSRRRNP